MAIKLSIDLSDATFAELSAVIGYAHRLGIDPDEKLTFNDNVITLEFDGDLHFDDVFDAFDEAELELDEPGQDGPIYAEDLIEDEDDLRSNRSSQSRGFDEEVINDIRDGVNTFVEGIMNGLGQVSRNNNFNKNRGFRNDTPFGPFGPFGNFGPGNRGPRF